MVEFATEWEKLRGEINFETSRIADQNKALSENINIAMFYIFCRGYLDTSSGKKILVIAFGLFMEPFLFLFFFFGGLRGFSKMEVERSSVFNRLANAIWRTLAYSLYDFCDILTGASLSRAYLQARVRDGRQALSEARAFKVYLFTSRLVVMNDSWNTEMNAVAETGKLLHDKPDLFARLSDEYWERYRYSNAYWSMAVRELK